MSTRLTVGYALAGVVIAASTITATAATVGIRGDSPTTGAAAGAATAPAEALVGTEASRGA